MQLSREIRTLESLVADIEGSGDEALIARAAHVLQSLLQGMAGQEEIRSEVAGT